MFCTHCGKPIEKDHNFCSGCGFKLSEPIKQNGTPLWFKVSAILIVLVSCLAGYSFYNDPHFLQSIDNQLASLKENQKHERQARLLKERAEEFQSFLKSQPLFSQMQSIQFDDKILENLRGLVKGTIQSKEGKSLLVGYQVAKENDQWNMKGFEVLDANPTKSADWMTRYPSVKIDEEIDLLIKSVLASIKNRDFSAAYENYFSNDFKRTTSLEHLEDFIHKHPQLENFKSFRAIDEKKEEDHAKITLLLIFDTDMIPLRVNLVKEGAAWKIWSLRLTSLPVEENNVSLPEADFPASNIRKLIENQISDIRRGDLNSAYENYFALAFKQENSLEQFKALLSAHPLFYRYLTLHLDEIALEGERVLVKGVLTGEKEKTFLFYTLAQEEGKWKALRLEAKDEEELEKERKIEFSEALIGSSKDENGLAIGDAHLLKERQKEIYVNLFINHGKKGESIGVTLSHLDSDSHLAPLNYSLNKPGSSIASFVFFPPPKGWPKGNYTLLASSSAGEEKTFSFQIE